MELQNIKELLPPGSYERISSKVGIAAGTVAQFFTGKARVGKLTKERIQAEALAIIEEQKEKAEDVLKAHAVAA